MPVLVEKSIYIGSYDTPRETGGTNDGGQAKCNHHEKQLHCFV